MLLKELFIFCNATGNFYVGVDSRVFMLVDVGMVCCSLFLAVLAI
jgi:hypothetical protein